MTDKPLGIKDILDAGVEEKLSSGEAKTKEEARALVSAERRRKLAEQEQLRLEKMVAAGEAESIEEARAVVAERTEGAFRAATGVEAVMLNLETNLDRIGAAASVEMKAAKELASRASVHLPRVEMPPIPVSPVPGLIKESVDVTKALVHEIARQGEQNRERVRAVESAVNEVRDEQREQGQRTRKLRKVLWIWGTAVSVLIALGSSSAVAQLWGWLTGRLAGG